MKLQRALVAREDTMTAENKRPLPPIPPIDQLQKVHVIGICGTAMGTLAAMLKEQGREVTGSDAMAYPPMSTWLEARGLEIREGYRAEHIPEDVDLVVVGNVSRRDNPESVAAHERGLLCLSMPEVLSTLFFPDRRVLAITGTHGKTTASSMLAWILFHAGLDPSFFIGGVTGNFGSNYRLGGGDTFVIEGDEYDTAWFDKVPKFWHYPALHAVINNIEYDHADIYPTLESIKHVFRRFAAQIPDEGTLWVNADDANALECAREATATVRSFGLADDAYLQARAIEVTSTGMRCELVVDGESQGIVELPTQGVYNLRNFLAAAGLAASVGVPWLASIAAIAEFVSTRRRQEFVGEARGVRVFDDFAHHPTAVTLTLDALRAQFPDARIHVAFEAKSNTSRRAVFQQDYVEAFARADSLALAPPWKKDTLPPDQLLSIDQLVGDLQARGVPTAALGSNEEIVAHCVSHARACDIIAVLSGSSFGGLPQQLLDALRA